MVPRWLTTSMSRSRMKLAAISPLTSRGAGIGPLLRRVGGIFRDHEPDGAAARPTPILRHDEIAAACLGERLGALQFRARRRLEARHSCSSFGGSRHNG
jgi:hypothetical protein